MTNNAQNDEKLTNGQAKEPRPTGAVTADLEAGGSAYAVEGTSEMPAVSTPASPAVDKASGVPASAATKPRRLRAAPSRPARAHRAKEKPVQPPAKTMVAAGPARAAKKQAVPRNPAVKRAAGKSSASISAPAAASAARRDGEEMRNIHAVALFGWQDSAHELQQTVLHFTQANISAQFGFIREMMSQRDPVQIMSLQQSFLRERLVALSRQMREVSRLSGRLAGDAMKPMQEGISRVMQQSAGL
ncbi:phasin family protein [Rhodoligotrophos defluvii]|uniref:phasin family protein n=1 Tax=Rhodoligotrophos defluvii TaxID=2561934 RepID=UPI0010C997C5|nr:phasin family protein [Rhodoligotrophos defluvii]